MAHVVYDIVRMRRIGEMEMEMAMREIGGEYWLEERRNLEETFPLRAELLLGEDNRLVFSGRTASDCVISDIASSGTIRSVYMPSYCCYSMVQPFIDNQVRVDFYGVNHSGAIEYDIDPGHDCDVFFAMTYFGYRHAGMQEWVDHFKGKNSIVIEDVTHSLFQEINHCKRVDYLVVSLRKWFPIISGGLACKMVGTFKPMTLADPPGEWMEAKKDAMLMKWQYLTGGEAQLKERYMKAFHHFNATLKSNYRGYGMDPWSVGMLHLMEWDDVKRKRIMNSHCIYEKIRNVQGIELPFELKAGDCPLFVPVLLEEGKRDRLSGHLIENSVYCPNHWAHSRNDPYSQGESNIYDRELSLVCDQRYALEDVASYLDLVVKELSH